MYDHGLIPSYTVHVYSISNLPDYAAILGNFYYITLHIAGLLKGQNAGVREM